MQAEKINLPDWRLVNKRVAARDWKTLCRNWLEFVPSEIRFDRPPDEQSASNLDMITWLQEYPLAEAEAISSDDFSVFRSLAFSESMFKLMKCVYLAEGALAEMQAGRPSWSPSTAYHSAFFGAQAILGFLGVHLVSLGRREFVIDLWPAAPVQKKHKRIVVKPDYATKAIKCRPPLHRHKWGLFRRLMNVAKVEGWLKVNLTLFNEIGDEKEFSIQRNRLHYRTDYWPLADLDGALVALEDSIVQMDIGSSSVASPNDIRFSIVLALEVARMGILLLEELAALATHLQAGTRGLDSRIARCRVALGQSDNLTAEPDTETEALGDRS